MIDHRERAEDALDRAQDWADRDNVQRETRAHMVDHYLRVAQIHATLASAQAVDRLHSHFEERPIWIRSGDVI